MDLSFRSAMSFGRPVRIFAMASTSFASTLTVDGDASDWGFSVADNNGSTFTPSLTLDGLFVEDSSDTAGDGGYVGPNHGGQNYDGEALAVAVQGSDLFIVIVSGQRPDNGLARYAPGDVQIVTSGGVYGVEVGGGVGGGAGTMLIGGDVGSTYTLNSNGYTTSYSDAAAAQTAGSVWLDPTWINDPIAPATETQFQMTGGTHVGDADYRFTRDSSTTQHSIIEMSLPLSIFGAETITSILWHPSCGNDELAVGTMIVPEPGTWVLATFGVLALAPLVRKRRRRQ